MWIEPYHSIKPLLLKYLGYLLADHDVVPSSKIFEPQWSRTRPA